MSRIIIIRGNSGSGKTSLARALQRRLGRNTLVIPQDTVRREMLWAKDGPDTAALPLLKALLQYGHDHCDTVILEGILYADWYRPLFEQAQALFGAHIYAYYYDLPFEETLRRHETKANRFSFGEADMRRWWRERDLIGLLEERIISQDSSLEETAERILHDLDEHAEQ